MSRGALSTHAESQGTDPILELGHWLELVPLPQSRQGLLAHARACGMSEATLQLLHQFPDWQYAAWHQLSQALALVVTRPRGSALEADSTHGQRQCSLLHDATPPAGPAASR